MSSNRYKHKIDTHRDAQQARLPFQNQPPHINREIEKANEATGNMPRI